MIVTSARHGIPPARVPLLRRLPARLSIVDPQLVFFESWHGRFSDSPRAIAEELRRRDLPFRQVWALRDPAEAPEWVTPVPPDGLAYLRALGQARFLVSNNTLPGYFRKRSGSFYLQTWHGTPLKRIAFDIGNADFRERHRKYFAHLRREVGMWDALVSPNRFSTDVFRTAFGYQGRIIESGYPRNDPLSTGAAQGIRDRVRRDLDVPAGVRAVLYAPTWRDDRVFSLKLDIERLADALPDEILLLRFHELVADSVRARLPAMARDVSARPEVSELFLAADVLLTDYSSVMFDFAVTGKPMVFFTYDLRHYRDTLRGFYFDFEAEAPGPLVTSTEAVVEALRNLEAITRVHATAYARFRARFCGLEDGSASSRVVSEVFER